MFKQSIPEHRTRMDQLVRAEADPTRFRVPLRVPWSVV
jgi:hypothetical protein